MAQTCIQQFQEKYYLKFFLEAAEKTILHFVDHEAQIAKLWRAEWNRYLEQIAVLQREQGGEPVEEITISFLYTSLEGERTMFRVDSYAKGGCVLKPCMAEMFLPADWLTAEAVRMEERLNRCVAEEGLRGFVRPAACEVLKRRAIRSLLYYFAGRMKYFIREVIDERYLSGIKKTEVFAIRFGEYMDWQKPLLARLPEVDIFDCAKGTLLAFRRFPAVCYQDKVFSGFNFTQAEFTDCTFSGVVIENCVMNDCIFDGCTFEQVTVKDTQMAGALFKGCTMRGVVFSGVVFTMNAGTGSVEETEAEQGLEPVAGSGAESGGSAGDPEYFEPVEFAGCGFTAVRFADCILSGAVVGNCEAEGLEVENGDICESDFLELEGVVWNREVQDGIF